MFLYTEEKKNPQAVPLEHSTKTFKFWITYQTFQLKTKTMGTKKQV